MMPEHGGFSPKEAQEFRGGGAEIEMTPEGAERALAAFEQNFKTAYEAARANPKDKEAAETVDRMLEFYNQHLRATAERKITPPKHAVKPTRRFEATA